VLSIYIVVLLLLSIAAASSRMLAWAAAFFGPAGHELVARFGSNAELTGRPKFVRPQEGVMVLDVLPGSPAVESHIRSGDVVLEVNGRAVSSRDELRAALEEMPVPLEMVVREAGELGRERLIRLNRVVDSLGVISVPEPGDEVHVEFKTRSPLRTLTNRILAIFGIRPRS